MNMVTLVIAHGSNNWIPPYISSLSSENRIICDRESLSNFYSKSPEKDTIYIILGEKVNPNIFPKTLGNIPDKLSWLIEPIIFPDNTIIITEEQRRKGVNPIPIPSNEKRLSPFDFLFNYTDVDILNQVVEISLISTFWILERLTIDCWHSNEKEKGLLAFTRMNDYVHLSSFVDLIMDQYETILSNSKFYFPKTSEDNMVSYNPIDALGFRGSKTVNKPHTYVINLPFRTDRKERMTVRLQKHKLPFTFVQAESKDSPIVKYYSYSSEGLNNNTFGYDKMAEFACFTSHIKAIREFFLSGSSVGLILEDDAVFHNNFDNLYFALLAKLPPKFSVVSFLVSNIEYYQDIHKSLNWTSKLPHIVKLDHRAWGCVGYLISRPYALHVLSQYDRPYIHCNKLGSTNRVTSEVIMMHSNGYASIIPVIIEEMGPSNINERNPLFHKTLFSPLGFGNYEKTMLT